MAKAKTKKQTDGKIVNQPVIKKETALPLLADQTFGSFGFGPSRVHQDNVSSHLTRFHNIREGISPFQTQGHFVTARDPIWLCQKAYFNVAAFRNAINTLVELCNTSVYLEGGNEQSEAFFEAWFKRINLWKLKDMFFRELFRSGNVFLFRLDGDITKSDALKLSQTYGAFQENLQIPLRYILLNVADISALNTLTFDQPAYFKILTPQQVQLLKKSTNPDDKVVYKNLSKTFQDYFSGELGAPIPIDLSKLHTIFYQKQDYEPFAIPMGFSVLDDINLKLEFKKTDAILARTLESATLLVTQGSEAKADGTGGTSQAALAALRELFSKEQIGRVLVSDWSTKLQWVIPDLAKAIGPEKYTVVNQDIAAGLMDIFFGDQKFANVVAKLKVFVEKLNRVQEIFLNDFLQSEIRRIAELMNFKSYPTAKFIRVSLDDPTATMRIFAQLMQLGILTAKDGVEAIETGELPGFEDLVENQKLYKTLKDEGLFQPVLGGVQDQLKVVDATGDQQLKIAKETGKQQQQTLETQQTHEMKMTDKQNKHAAANPPPAAPSPIHINLPGTKKAPQPTGRPAGTKAPQTTKKVSPIGTGKGSEQKFSMSKLIDTVKLMSKVRNDFILAYRKENKIRRLTDEHKELIDQIANTLFENEKSEEWEKKIEAYAKDPVPPDIDKALEIEEIASEYEISPDAAILLYHSKI